MTYMVIHNKLENILDLNSNMRLQDQIEMA